MTYAGVPSEVELIEVEGLLNALDVAHDARRRFYAFNYTHDSTASETIWRRKALKTSYEMAKTKLLSGDRNAEIVATVRRLIDLVRDGYLEGPRYSDAALAALSDQDETEAATRTNPKDAQ